MLAPDGTLKAAADLKVIFEQKGLEDGKPIVFSCKTGVMATFCMAAATKAGFTADMKIFDGSHDEYKAKMEALTA